MREVGAWRMADRSQTVPQGQSARAEGVLSGRAVDVESQECMRLPFAIFPECVQCVHVAQRDTAVGDGMRLQATDLTRLHTRSNRQRDEAGLCHRARRTQRLRTWGSPRWHRPCRRTQRGRPLRARWRRRRRTGARTCTSTWFARGRCRWSSPRRARRRDACAGRRSSRHGGSRSGTCACS